MTLNRKFKSFYHNLISRLKNIKGEPRYVALGMAIGVFIGATPFFPFHTSIALILAILLKGSRIAAAAGVWVSNPITIPFFYISTYKIGAYILGIASPISVSNQSFSELLGMGFEITRAMALGGIILGIPLSIAGYYITLRIITVFRNHRIPESL